MIRVFVPVDSIRPRREVERLFRRKIAQRHVSTLF
jgi:hypothetical protein